MASSHSEDRKALSEDVIRKTTEIQAIIERIHQVRFDGSRDGADRSRIVKNLVLELKRLEADLNALRRKQLEALETALDLSELGLPDKLISQSKLTQSRSNIIIPESSTPERHVRIATSLDDEALSEEDMTNLKLMRTDSTDTLEGKPAKHKWNSLFKMFQEWKRETSIAQAQYAMASGSGAFIDDEITKIRAAILALQRKKNLPASEEDLLHKLQIRLQQLIKAQKSLVNTPS